MKLYFTFLLLNVVKLTFILSAFLLLCAPFNLASLWLDMYLILNYARKFCYMLSNTHLCIQYKKTKNKKHELYKLALEK